MVLAVGSKIKDDKNETYVLDTVIGRGGFGDVYKAYRESDNFVVAVKVLSTSFGDSDSLLSFQRELLQTQLVSSENVIKYYYVHNGKVFSEYPPYIIMEYAEGGTLNDLINKQRATGNQFDLSVILEMLSQLANGMKEISKFLVHRDIKPENILIRNGKLKISDFGLSKLSDVSTRTMTFKGYGTQKYAAPEVWNNDKNTIQIDIYSMGIVFYELATLQYPYDIGLNKDYEKAHLYSAIKSPSNYNRELPQNIVSVIIRMLEKPTQKRFKNWDEIISGLSLKPTHDNLVENYLNIALANRNQEDIRLQKEIAEKEREEKKKSDYIQLIYSQYNNTVFEPIRTFVDQFNEAYPGLEKCIFKGAEPFRESKNFSVSIRTPQKKYIRIETEIIFIEKQQKITYNGLEYYEMHTSRYSVPQCNKKDVLAWSRVYDDSEYGFNLLLLKNENSMYGDWYILENRNSSLSRTGRNEPFGFELNELPKEIKYIDCMHIYTSELKQFDITKIYEFLADHI